MGEAQAVVQPLEQVEDALLIDLRAKLGATVSDPTRDINVVADGVVAEISVAPQIILSDFRVVRSRFRTMDREGYGEDREAGTYMEAHVPGYYNLEFTITTSDVSPRAAKRRVTALAAYFDGWQPITVVDAGGVTRVFEKELAAEFTERSVPNAKGIKVYETRARVLDIPVADGEEVEGRLAEKFVAETIDGRLNPADPGTVNGTVLDVTEVEAGG